METFVTFLHIHAFSLCTKIAMDFWSQVVGMLDSEVNLLLLTVCRLKMEQVEAIKTFLQLVLINDFEEGFT